MAAVLADTSRREEFRGRGLVGVSEELESAQDEARRLVGGAMDIRLAPDETSLAGVDRLIARQAAALRTSATSLRALGNERDARILELRAEGLEAGQPVISNDPLLEAYTVTLFELGAMLDEVPRNMEQLDIVLRVLAETHAVVHEWVMTDATISGAVVGELLESNAELLGLGSGQGGSP